METLAYPLSDLNLPMSMCGENLLVGLTLSIPRLSRSLSPDCGGSAWMAAGWSLYMMATLVWKLIVSETCQPPSLS